MKSSQRSIPASSGFAGLATGLVLAVGAVVFGTPACAAPIVEWEWKTGHEFQRQLDAKVGLYWPESKLRDALRRLARDQQVAVFLDRRVDPDAGVSIDNRDTALEEVFLQLAEHCGLGVGYIGPVVYFAQRPAAVRASTLVALRQSETTGFDRAVQSRLAQRRPFKWEMLAEPRELIAAAAQQYGVRVFGGEQIPHDLWPAADLPELTFAERMTLLLTGFDLTFEWSRDGSAIRLVPVDNDALVEHVYTVPASSRRAVDQLAARFPAAEIANRDGRLSVTATYADHHAIRLALAGRAERPPAAGANGGDRPGAITHFTLTIANTPAGAVVQTVAKRQNWELKVDDPQVYEQLKSLVSFSVKEVSLDELMQTALKPLGLTYRLEGDRLRILAAKQE